MARKHKVKDRRKNGDNEDVVVDKDVEGEQQQQLVVPSLPPTRETDQLYASYETFACAMDQGCIPCAYKVGCFDVALDKEFSKSVPNQRPEQCPRNNNTGSNDNGILGFRRGMSILTVGDGDFTFSLGLARRLLLLKEPSDSNNDDNTKKKNLNENDDNETFIVATSYESEATLRKVYPNFDQTLQELDDLGVAVAYNVDATQIPETYKNTTNNNKKFHRICWNFPCTNITKGQDGQNKDMEQNKDLVRNFVKSAQSILTNHGDGELYICHKTKPPFNQWNLEEVALENMVQNEAEGKCTFSSPRSLFYTGRIVLDKFLLPPYVPRKALDQKSFPCHDACFYIFAQKQSQREDDDLSMKLFPPTIIQHNDGDNIHNGRSDERGDVTAAAVAAEQNLGQMCNSTTLIKIYPDLIQLIRRRHIHATTTRKRGNSTSYGATKSKRSTKRIKRSY